MDCETYEAPSKQRYKHMLNKMNTTDYSKIDLTKVGPRFQQNQLAVILAQE